LTRLTHASCLAANRLGFQLQAPGCELIPESGVELPLEAHELICDEAMPDLIAQKINSVEASLGPR
jgi:hypothetical protein